jgi:hypothetical protein
MIFGKQTSCNNITLEITTGTPEDKNIPEIPSFSSLPIKGILTDISGKNSGIRDIQVMLPKDNQYPLQKGLIYCVDIKIDGDVIFLKKINHPIVK